MDDISVKLYDVNGGDVRRFPFQVPKDVKSSFTGIYAALVTKIEQICAINNGNKKLSLAWKDDEGDLIVMQTDEEVKEALRQMKNGIFRVFVRIVDNNNVSTAASVALDPPNIIMMDTGSLITVPQPIKIKEPINVIIGDNVPLDNEPPRRAQEEDQTDNMADTPSQNEETNVHGGIICDGCDQHGFDGVRFKCLICPDFDLCSTCEGKRIHDEHPMIRIPKPNDNTWQSAFFAAQGMNRFANFRGGRHGRCPYYGGGGHHRRGPHGHCEQQQTNGEQRQQQEQQRPQQEVPGSQFLRDVGQAVAAVLNGFGIDVDIDVENQDGQRTKVAAPKNNDATPASTQTNEQMAPTGGEAVVDQSMENVTSNLQAVTVEENMETGSHTPDGQHGWTLLDSTDAPPQESQPIAAAAAATPQSRLDAAVSHMLSMGFTNEGGWLTQLLEAKNGDIEAVLEILHPSDKN